MDTIRKRNSVLLFKLETNEGDDAHEPWGAYGFALVGEFGCLYT